MFASIKAAGNALAELLSLRAILRTTADAELRILPSAETDRICGPIAAVAGSVSRINLAQIIIICEV
jgi:hypothetical protein